jgi:hypothetical protein
MIGMAQELARPIAIGFPAFAGILLGIRASSGGRDLLLMVLAAGVVAFILAQIGRKLLAGWPRVGRMMIDFVIVSAIAAVALITAASISLATAPPIDWLTGGSPPNDDHKKVLASTLATGFGAYVAFIWTKDIAEGKGVFWPSTQFRQGLAALYQSLPEERQPPGGTKAFAAFFEPTIEGYGAVGWGYLDRWTRANIVAKHLAKERS